MSTASEMEVIRFVISLIGVAVSLWGCWDAVLDVLAMFGRQFSGWTPRLRDANWRSAASGHDVTRADRQRFRSLCMLQRVVGRLWMLMVQLILSTSGLLEPGSGADWKLVAQMSGVIWLAANALTDRAERNMTNHRIKPPKAAA